LIAKRRFVAVVDADASRLPLKLHFQVPENNMKATKQEQFRVGTD